MTRNRTKQIFTILLFLIITTAAYAKTFIPGIKIAPCISGGIGGTPTQSHTPGLGFEAGIFCETKINQQLSLITELNFSYQCFSYIVDGQTYGNGKNTITYSSLQLPLLLQWKIFNVFGTNGNIGIYIGEVISLILKDQNFKNEGRSFSGNFLWPTTNISLSAGAEYLYPVANFLLGFDLRCTFDLLENELNYRGNTIRTGRLLHFSPSVNFRINL